MLGYDSNIKVKRMKLSFDLTIFYFETIVKDLI